MDPLELAIRANPTRATISGPEADQAQYSPTSDNFIADPPSQPAAIQGLWTAQDVQDGSFSATFSIRAEDMPSKIVVDQTQVAIQGVTYRVIDYRPRWYVGRLNGYTLKLAK